MDRLTTVNGNNNIELVINESRVRIKDTDTLAVAKKLKEYEDMEEQDRLLKLPCKVGNDVYYILGIPNKTPCAIDKCKFELSDINKIGKTLFLTREEAEAKLKELRGINSETNRNEIEEIER